MTWQQEKQNLIYKIKDLSRSIASQILNDDIEKLVKQIDRWTERDVRVNMDEYCAEVVYYKPEHGVLYPELIERLELQPEQSVLEVGVGTGNISLMHMKPFDYYGIDSSLFAVLLAKQNAKNLGISPDRILYSSNGDFHFTEKFDACFCVSVIHEAKSPQQVLQRMVENVKEKGRVVIAERITDILETPEHYQVLLRGVTEIPIILHNMGLNIKSEYFNASYSGCNHNQNYIFYLVYGEK